MAWMKKEITRGIRKYFELSENKSTAFQDLWNTAKALLTGKFKTKHLC